jgi:hypothetical protein
MVPLVGPAWLDEVALDGVVVEALVSEDGGIGGISEPDVVLDADVVIADDEVADDGAVLVSGELE